MIDLVTQEVERIVKNIVKRGYTEDEAIRMLDVGIEDIKAEVERRRNKSIARLREAYRNYREGR